jgi:hypothetical protein
MIWRSDYGREEQNCVVRAGSSFGSAGQSPLGLDGICLPHSSKRLYKGERLAGMSLERHDKRGAEVER